MTRHRPVVDVQNLRSIGTKARNEHAILGSVELPGKNVYGCCIEITKHIRDTLHSEYEIPTEATKEYRCGIGPNLKTHYAVAIDAQHVPETSKSGTVIVDAAIDQFCDEQYRAGRVHTTLGSYSEIRSVTILFPEDERRKRWYHNPTGDYDPSTEYIPSVDTVLED